jgi:hypothetical protein
VVTYSLVKTASDEAGDRQLAREAQWLRELADVRSLEGQLPRLLDEGTNVQGRRFLVMSVAQGWGETRAFTAGHERFLSNLGKARFRSTDIRSLGSQLFVYEWGSARSEASPLDDVLHYLIVQRALHGRSVNARFLVSAMKRAREFALAAYPDWSWRAQVIGALTLVYLLGALLHHSLPARRVDHGDPVVRSYLNLIQTRSAWMPGND